MGDQSGYEKSPQFPSTTQATQDSVVDMQEPLTSQDVSLQMSSGSSTSSDRSSPSSAFSASFCSIMSTPAASSKGKKRTQRKKSINYRATVVSKALFYGKEKKNAKGKNKKSPLFGKEKNARSKNKRCRKKNHVQRIGIAQYARKVIFRTWESVKFAIYGSMKSVLA